MKYLIASNRSFNDSVVATPEELEEYIRTHPNLERIYFPFWSWKVPKHILDKIICVGFHASPLPRGKGGTPIQNMIKLGYDNTELCMFRMTNEWDKGDVIKRTNISLKGSLSEIVDRLRWVILNMINDKDSYNEKPSGNFNNVPENFKRITDNLLPQHEKLSEIYDEIRMRDEEGHPKAFKYHGKYKIEFTDAELKKGEVRANVRIKEG